MGNSALTPRMACRLCGSEHGTLVLDLGAQPLANRLLRREDLDRPEPRFPLRVFVCTDCWLLQLTDVVPPGELFSDYTYFSSYSDAMLHHARTAVERYCSDYRLDARSFVVEVASNDGYLLENFGRKGVPALGIEPAENVARVARQRRVDTWARYFGADCARDVLEDRGPADLILANNVLAHAPDLRDFLSGIATLLAREGRAVFEFPYAGDLIARTEFDTIYHEHVYYFSLTPLVAVLREQGLRAVRVERISIHGGSLRLFVGHADAALADRSVEDLLSEERQSGLCGLSRYVRFASDVEAVTRGLRLMVDDLRGRHSRIAAYGAAAKGSTLMNACRIERGVIEFVADRSPHKQGRFTPGTHVPIVPADELARRQPDVTLLLAWNFADEILDQQKAYRSAGGRFLIPIPSPRLV